VKQHRHRERRGIGVSDNDASRRYGALEDRAIYFGYSLSQTKNFGSRAVLIGADDEAHCPLIEEIVSNQDMGRWA
jgi:hypothetical protein